MSKRVLIVEDNIVNQEVLSEFLECLDFTSDVADNGRIALEKVEKENYDLILMDLQMPEMDGIEATKRIRRKFHKVPIIAITASMLHSDQCKCSDAGMNGYLTKPYTFEQVKEIVEKFLK